MITLATVFVILLVMAGLACVFAERDIAREERARDRADRDAEWGRL